MKRTRVIAAALAALGVSLVTSTSHAFETPMLEWPAYPDVDATIGGSFSLTKQAFLTGGFDAGASIRIYRVTEDFGVWMTPVIGYRGGLFDGGTFVDTFRANFGIGLGNGWVFAELTSGINAGSDDDGNAVFAWSHGLSVHCIADILRVDAAHELWVVDGLQHRVSLTASLNVIQAIIALASGT
ncbi:MAG: hypothetical protein U0271_27655 [Polyangiaceae bacterium]